MESENQQRAGNVAQPRCPGCSALGMDKIISQESTEVSKSGDHWFDVVFCRECGHVYGVFAKHVLSSQMPTSPFR